MSNKFALIVIKINIETVAPQGLFNFITLSHREPSSTVCDLLLPVAELGDEFLEGSSKVKSKKVFVGTIRSPHFSS